MDAGRRTALIRGALAILAVVVFYMVWSSILFYLYINYSPVEQVEREWVGPGLWVALPQLFSSFLMVVIAAWTFGRERLRARPGWYLVLTPPALVLVIDVVTGVEDDPWRTLLMQFVAVAVGVAAAFWLVRPRKRERVDLFG